MLVFRPEEGKCVGDYLNQQVPILIDTVWGANYGEFLNVNW